MNKFELSPQSILLPTLREPKGTRIDTWIKRKKLSAAIGTNRIYVARCIKEHTGMTFNDYMNSKRVEFMANLLRQNPTQNQKQLFFAAGFRSYPTAHRNFTKFKGCSPTEYTEKVS